jgi:hypothetical protein
MDPKEKMRRFREYVIRPVLHNVIMQYSYEVELLLAGTAAHESEGFRYRKQQGGPALGLYQMEPSTYKWLWTDFLRGHRNLARRIKKLLPAIDPLRAADHLVHNDQYATAMARVRYLAVPEPIPHVTAPVGSSEVKSLAQYWGKYYQTDRDPEKIRRFVDHFKLWVMNTN